MWLILALIAVPIIEIALFIEIGDIIGLWPTIGIVIATAIAGGMLLRAQGFQAMQSLQAQLNRGEDPSATLAHGAMILIAGVLMLTPGFFTDTVGFLLLIPAVRAALIKGFASRISVVSMQAGMMHPDMRPGSDAPGHATVDGDYVDVTPEPDNQNRAQNRPGSGPEHGPSR